MPPTLTAARVAIVSGKGGVGKTTVAAALAIAAARAGSSVLLAEIEDRDGIAPLFGLRTLDYTERALGPNLNGLSVIADEALVEYLQLFYGIPRVSRTLLRAKVLEFATNTAPGLRDILLIGKVREAERRRHEGKYVYDLVVLDAPPTGRLPRFLDAPRAIVDLVRGGPIRTQAQSVLDMTLDPKRCQVVLVTNPEEMPVRETAEAAEGLAKMGLALGPIVVNAVWPDIGSLGKDPEATLRAQTKTAGMQLNDVALEQLAIVAGAHARRVHNQRAAMKTLKAEIAVPQIVLPALFTDGIGHAEIESLATMLADSGAL